MEQVATPSWRQRLGEWVESRAVQNTIIAVIVFNAITLGLETSEPIMAAWGPTLIALERIILAIFVVEIALKLVAFDVRFFRSAWNVFDFSIVAISLIPASGPFAILRALRILRVLRLIAKVPRLRKLIESLLRALPSIGWVVFLLLMVFYIFAVMGTQLFGEAFPKFFGTLGESFYTLFQVMTLESWSMSVARPVIDAYPLAWIYFIGFILITSLTVLNLFIGIIVTTMQESVHADDVQQRADIEAKAHAERQEMLRLLQQVHARMDALEQHER
jgi:voltage-gated sodium channel